MRTEHALFQIIGGAFSDSESPPSVSLDSSLTSEFCRDQVYCSITLVRTSKSSRMDRAGRVDRASSDMKGPTSSSHHLLSNYFNLYSDHSTLRGRSRSASPTRSPCLSPSDKIVF